MSYSEPIGVVRAAVYLPSHHENAAFIAGESGVPEDVVKNKMGIKRKCRALPDEQPSEMAIAAAQHVLQDIDPQSIDLLIWTGSEYKDHIVWSAGIYVQEALKLRNAWAFDIGARCSNKILGLRLARDLMKANPKIKRALLCGGHKTGDLVDYADSTTRFLHNLADGGSAMLLERGHCNPILESSFLTDGQFSKDVIIPAGGTRKPNRHGSHPFDTYLRVPNVEDMREKLAACSLTNFLHVIREAATTSMPQQPIDYLALLHMKKSIHNDILQHLELGSHQSIYLDEYGHFGAPDQVLSLGLAEKANILRPGSHVVLAAAGIGYTWSAISIRWDKPFFVTKSITC